MTKKYGLAALTGIALIVIGFGLKEMDYKVSLMVVGALMIIPFFIHETVFVVGIGSGATAAITATSGALSLS